ncbi:TspO/MBR family protein [Breznakia pachnodae]|uniref:Tryptophan-rich sensory protein n=1 Tax=Breznakia pachnodae TaxID=265178 RepID=A0ABU0E5Z9_9FIRM|nr:TspO/MBR family protein [Breznakia pachnodae]MDQ0362319.1 tryptophan-rich sensory protein [Breznakia pachnodae]
MKVRDFFGVVFSVLISEGIGFLSSLFAGDLKASYATFTKPVLAPPDWLFGIAWAILYLFMGIAAYLVYRSNVPKVRKKIALVWYAIQLFINFIWSIIFFRADSMWIAFAVIIILDILVLITMIRFRQINKNAFLLMVPYFIWILFATYLNVAFAILN